jgi:hypothetical protein
VAGGSYNLASGFGAFVGGGGRVDSSRISGNTASGVASAIAGGYGNTASGLVASVGGGYSNTASGAGAFVGGGGHDGTVAAGNHAAGAASTIGGGFGNRIPSSGGWATVGGGRTNFASGAGATVAGGTGSLASGGNATVGGGTFNTASGGYATIPGGLSNSATMSYTLASGRRANAVNDGAFVWADSTDADFDSTANDQFLVRANGGVGINTSSPATNTLTVGGSGLRVATDGTTLARIQAGTASLGAGIAGVNVFTVTFATAFQAPPRVNVTVRYGQEDVPDTFAVSLRSVSSSQFKVNVYRVDIPASDWGQSLQLDWMAWE